MRPNSMIFYDMLQKLEYFPSYDGGDTGITLYYYIHSVYYIIYMHILLII
jgi:hypothetical protein